MEATMAATDPAARGGVLWMYERMMRIRCFEETVQELHKRGLIPGTAHLYIGEEAIAVGACSTLEDDDRITSTHRGHGHLIAKGADVRLMMAEIFGRRDGYCKGKGGSMHICDVSLGILGANGIVGGGIPIATGAGLADRVLERERVTVCFFGDGAANQGVLHEALNLSSLWKLPVVYICENNQYNEWTPSAEVTSGRIADRATAFGVPGTQIDGNDVYGVRETVGAAVARARTGKGPSLIEAITYRHRGHEEGEEAYGVPKRPQEEVDGWVGQDPLVRFRSQLVEEEGISASALEAIDEREGDRIAEAVSYAEASQFPDPAEALEDLYLGKGV
ncbi:MAG TPA: thiamine pyrophosphate-dependent dehydrogenase E1 component subunit alpha [Actinomycetota bacterium]|jgi:pyruvate dehydrogenase E1 component alpha subunit|nr:thiamine pyrophosphate-dependent dehydrogenase E1 component subunit alpha [Actinomycetota bacterium]